MMDETARDSQATVEKRRLFIALPLPAAVRDLIGKVQQQFRPLGWPVKWVDPGQAHITLKFLGDTDSSQVPDIERTLGDIARRHGPLEFAAGGCGGFPSLNRPQVLWVGASGDTQAAGELAGEINAALSRLGIDPERREFRPHITIGRVRRGRFLPGNAGRLIQQLQTEPVPMRIERFELVESVLGRSGPRYTPLAEWRLGTGVPDKVELVEHG